MFFHLLSFRVFKVEIKIYPEHGWQVASVLMLFKFTTNNDSLEGFSSAANNINSTSKQH